MLERRCYLVYGNELFQKLEIISQIKDDARNSGYNIIEIELNAHYKWEDLLNNCQSSDLFASKTLLELQIAVDNINKKGCETLLNVLEQQDYNTHILIHADKLTNTVLNTPWVKYIQTHGKVHATKPLNGANWTSWLVQRFKKTKLQPDAEVIKMLSQTYEGNPFAAKQCIEKLALALPAGTINLGDIQEFLQDNSRFNVFVLMQSVIAGDANRVITVYNSLREEDLEPAIMLWGVTRELRNLIKLHGYVKHGVDFNASAQKLGIWRDQMHNYKKALERLSLIKLNQLLQVAQRIDTVIKGNKPGIVWEPLLSILLSLAGSNHQVMEETPI